MRRNFFNEAYCSTAQEVLDELASDDLEAGDVYLAILGKGDNDTWEGEVANGFDGENILYIEAPTADAVKAIAKECGIDIQS